MEKSLVEALESLTIDKHPIEDQWKQRLVLLKKSDLIRLFINTVETHPELKLDVETLLKPFPLLSLQDELICYILSFLSPAQVLHVSQTCRILNRLSNDNFLWSRIVCSEFNLNFDDLIFKSINFKKYYKEHILRQNPDPVSMDTVERRSIEYPTKRQKHTASIIGHCIYYIGGEVPRDTTYRLNEIWKYDIESHLWTKLSPPTMPKIARHAAASIGTKIYVFGGYDGVEVYHELYCYDTETNIWNVPEVKGFKPPSRSNSAFACVSNKFFIYGGTGKGKVLDEFLMFDAESKVWTKLDHCKGDLPGPRTCSSLVAMDNKLYLYGGGLWSSEEQKWTNKYNDISCFDIERQEWRKIEAKGQHPIMSTSAALFTIGRCIYVYGGGHSNDTIVCGDMFLFDTVTNTWDRINPKNKSSINQRGRDCTTATTFNNEVYFYGGNYSFTYGNEQDFFVVRANYSYYQ